jgi:nucleoside-diphosphate-sugar epimerase
MKITITGASGFLGLALTKAWLTKGHEIVSLTRHASEALHQLGVKQVLGDLAEAAPVHEAVEGADLVYHVAAKAGNWGRRQDYEACNVIGTQHILQACRQFGVRSLVYTSSPSVITQGRDLCGVDESIAYPEHYEADYPRTKAIAEQMVLASCTIDLCTVALRPHLIWGPGDTQLFPRIIDRGRKNRLIQVGDGRNVVDVTYIDDAVAAHVRAGICMQSEEGRARIGGKAYFISSETPVELWKMVGDFLAIEGLPPPRKKVSLATAVRIGSLFERFFRFVGRYDEPRITRWVAHELGTSHWFDIRAAKRDLQWAPESSIEAGLAALALSVGKVPSARNIAAS